ncbi:hypothetical protein C7S14_6125 [Burkholderia cepacia]|nr:hypothetical protein C7S14_6125 [Burkholderia cepacia]
MIDGSSKRLGGKGHRAGKEKTRAGRAPTRVSIVTSDRRQAAPDRTPGRQAVAVRRPLPGCPAAWPPDTLSAC